MVRAWSMLTILTASVCASSAHAAPSLPAGEYTASGGWGALTLAPVTADVGSQAFTIETIGSNAHTCSLEGRIVDWQAILVEDRDADEADDAPRCVIDFKLVGADIAVSSPTLDACSSHCGARAGFDYTYRRPSAACTERQRTARREAFAKRYRARDYAQALVLLQRFDQDCGDLLFWMERDRVRNDLAITQYHLGRKADCLKTLVATRAGSVADAAALEEALPPTDFESYLPTAKAVWFNRRQCQQARR